MGKLTLPALLLGSSLLTTSALADDLKLVMGTLTFHPWNEGEGGNARQLVSVKNDTKSLIKWIRIECGFLQENKLVGVGHDLIKNLLIGETGYLVIQGSAATAPDRADCRIVPE